METVPDSMTFLKCIPHLGILSTLVSSLMLAVNSVMTAVVIGNDNALYVGALGCVFCLVVTLPLMAVKRNNPLGVPGERLLVFAYSILSAIAQAFSNYSFVFISVTDATTVFSTSTILVVIFAPIILKEPLRIIYILAAILSAGGVLLIERPSFLFPSTGNGSASNQTIGVVLSVSFAVLTALTSLINRKLLKTDVWVFQMSTNLLLAVGSVVAMLALGKPFTLSSFREYAFAIGSGLPYIFSTILLSFAFQIEEAGPVSITSMAQVPFVLVLQVCFLRTIPLQTTYYGSMLVLLGTFFTFFQEWKSGKEKLKQILEKLRLKSSKILHIPSVKSVSYDVHKQEPALDCVN